MTLLPKIKLKTIPSLYLPGVPGPEGPPGPPGSGDFGSAYVLAQDFTLISHTGTVAATILKTVPVQGNTLGPNGTLRVTALWSAGANNANSKLCIIRFGGTLFTQAELASNLGHRTECYIANTGVTNAQIGGLLSSLNVSTTDYFTGALDTAVDQDLTFRCQLANAGDTVHLRGTIVEVLRAS